MQKQKQKGIARSLFIYDFSAGALIGSLMEKYRIFRSRNFLFFMII